MKTAYSSDIWNWIHPLLKRVSPKLLLEVPAVLPREAGLRSPPLSDSVDNQELVLDFR